MTIYYTVTPAANNRQVLEAYMRCLLGVLATNEGQQLFATSVEQLLASAAWIVALRDDVSGAFIAGAHVTFRHNQKKGEFKGFVIPLSFRGQGHGRRLVVETMRHFDQAPGSVEWSANVRVMPDGTVNEASARCLEHAGFRRAPSAVRRLITGHWTDQHLLLTAEGDTFRSLPLYRSAVPYSNCNLPSVQLAS